MGQEKQVGIQVARAIAALGIVYFHSWVAITRFPQSTAYPIPGLSTYGWLSVDLFFAISGFVICLVLSRETFDVRSFLIKRTFRLYPLWLVMLTVFAMTAWLWRGFQPSETLEYFLYSATLLPTHGFPFYNVGWTLQHEIVFYLIAAAVMPFFGVPGLAAVLLASTISPHLIDLPWPLAKLAAHHGEFLAGVLAYIARDRMARFGFLIPFMIGAGLLVFFATHSHGYLLPIALFLLIAAFANLNPDEMTWWRKPIMALGDAVLFNVSHSFNGVFYDVVNR